MNLSANASVRRREEALLIRARLEQIDSKLNHALKEVGATAPAFPTEADIEAVGKLLVTGHMRLPRYAMVTVTTEVTETRDRVFGNSTILTHLCDQVCAHQLQPMSVQAAIEAGLLVKLGSNWMFSEATYRNLVPPDPRLLT
jgi:hypothetical protein